MSEPEATQGKLYTLSEISQKTGISMPTLQRYKKLYQNRIPSSGSGRKQRYPDNALPVFEELRNENLGRRGRPRKDPNAPRPAAAARGRAAKATAGAKRGRKAGSARPAPAAAAKTPGRRGRKPAAAAAGARGGSGNLMTLTQISEDTGISYPTLVRYVRLHSDKLPSEGKGRARRFYPQAADVFRQLRQESGRGGRKPGKKVGRPPGRPPGRPSGRPSGRPPGRPAAAAPAAAPARRGRPPGSGAKRGEEGAFQKRLRALERSQEGLEKRFKGFVQSLQKLFR